MMKPARGPICKGGASIGAGVARRPGGRGERKLVALAIRGVGPLIAFVGTAFVQVVASTAVGLRQTRCTSRSWASPPP